MGSSARTNTLIRFVHAFGVEGVRNNSSDREAALAINARYLLARQKLRGSGRELINRYRMLIRSRMIVTGWPCPMVAATDLVEMLDLSDNASQPYINAALCAAIELSTEASTLPGTGGHQIH